MKINNPKSMLDFTRDQSSNNIAQNLVTVGQLYTIANKLTAKFDNKLKGVEGAGYGGMSNRTDGGGYGYAWLDANGKLDTSLLPAIAISETHVMSESDLLEFDSVKANELGINVCQHYNSDRAEHFLHNYLSYHTKPTSTEFPNSKNLKVQKGDMIIVHPGNVTLENKKEPDKFELSDKREIPGEFWNSTQNPADIHVPNVRFSGSYMITEIDEEDGKPKFYFVKISYTDGNIVKINDCIPKNSAGEVEISLTDILKYTTPIQGADRTNSYNLTEAVNRLSFGTGSDSGRFYFIDNSDDNVTYVPYTKLDEHLALRNEVSTISSNLSSIINTYKEEHNEDVRSLTEQLSYASGLVSSTFRDELSGPGGVYENIGNRTAEASYSEDGAIFPQLKGLRNDISKNLTLLNNTRCDTNDYLALIRENVMALHNSLNENAVQMLSIPVEWSAPVLTGDFPDIPTELYNKDTGFAVTVGDIIKYENNIINVAGTDGTNLNVSEYLNVSDYSKVRSGGIGYRRWTLHYNPTVKTNWMNNGCPNERILAIFDNSDVNNTGEQIFPDITYSIFNNHVVTHISVDVEVTEETDGNMTGTDWTLYVAKTIGGIKNTFIDKNTSNVITFNVGGVSQDHGAHYSDDIVGNHTGSDQVTNN